MSVAVKDSKIYFGSIAKHEKKEYVLGSRKLDEKAFLEDIYSQIYILSKIVNSKYKSLRLAMISTSITLLYAILTILLI